MARVNQTQLEACFTHHFPYELNMMRDTLQSLSALPSRVDGEPSAVTVQRNVFIESFCIHARNLIEFFKNKPSCDFEPRDFATSGYLLKKNFIRPTLVDKLNEQVSHLSRNRTVDPSEKLDLTAIREVAAAIEGEVERMISALAANWANKRSFQSKVPSAAASHIGTATNAIQIERSVGFTDTRMLAT